MIKKLQRKIILVAMISVTVVLFLIIGIINVRNYVNVNREANMKLNVIKEYNGNFPYYQIPGNFSPEAPFETRYFTVIKNESGVYTINIDKIAAVDEKKAQNYVSKVNKKSGYIDSYKYLVVEEENETLYIFIDCSKDLTYFYSFLRASLIISFIGLIFVFGLIVIFSKIIIKPIIESYKKQKQFITDASHELKTPLTVIDADCEVLEYSLEDNEWLNSIKDQTKKLTDLTNKLVFLSRMNEENNKILMADFNLSEVANDLVSEYQSLAISQNKEFNVNIEPNITLYGEVSMIKQALHLMLDNAFKYSSNNGYINFNISKGKNIKIEMSNSVDEINVGSLNVLFERFYRLDSSRNSQTGGQGIGLSIVKAIVEAHKGKINAYSSDGKSIIFTIIL